MTSIKYSDEELYFFQVCKVTTHNIADGLRKVFKQEWNTRYQATYGQWQDTVKNGMDFYGMESTNNKEFKSRELSIMKKGNTNEWDCTCLFHGILYSGSIKPTLNATVRKSVEKLRTFRNEVFAHAKDAKLKEADFKTSIDKVITSFTALKLDTTEIEEIKNQTSFPTEELEDIKKQLEKEKKRNEEPRPFCVLPAKPSHATVSRLIEVDQINEEMERLRNTKNNEVTVVYLSGNPGCGKSEVARQIGERFFDEKSTEMNFVMTMNASTIDTLLQSYVEFADRVKCDEDFVTKIKTSEGRSTEEKISDLKCRIMPRLQKYLSWLIVVDNVSDLKSVSKYWPQAGEKTNGVGQILVTTQDSSSIPSDRHTYHLSLKQGMNADDAVQALCDISGMSCNNDITLQVAKALDFQPLALASAAVYMKRIKDTDCTKCLQKLEEGKREATEKEYKKTSLTYPKTMTSAVRMALEKEASEDKVMRHAFEFLSVIAPEPIPLQYVVQYVMSCLSDEDKDRVASTIRSSSLVLASEEDDVQEVRVHQVVHSCLQSTVNVDKTEFKVNILIINVVLAFIYPVTSVKALEYIEGILETQRLIVHFLSISSKISDIFDDPSDLAISVNVNIFHVIASLVQIGDICGYYAKHDACRIFHKISLKILEKEFNRSCLSIAETLNSLSKVFRNLDQNKEAEGCSERASAIRKRQQTFSFCRQTDNTRTPMHNVNFYDEGCKANELISFGNSCLNQKNFMRAKSFFEEALGIQETMYGNSHPLVASTHNKIGETLCLMKNDEEAKTHFEAALAIEDRIYNFIISILDSSLYALAKLFWDKGQYDNAEKYIEKAKEVLNLKEKEMHPSLGDALNYAGKTLCMMGKYDDAKRCLETALKIQEGMPNDTQVEKLVTLLNTQGEIMREMGQYKESKTNLSRALEIQKKESPSFADTLKNLGKTHVAMCQLNIAKECYEQALRNEQNAYGEDDPRMINSINELVEILRLMGKYKDAEICLKKAQTIQEKVAPFHKKTHPNFANTLKGLGDVLYDKGKSEEAKHILQKALAIQEDAYNTFHPELVDTLYLMSDTLLDMRRYDEAKKPLERALSILKQAFNDEHPDVATPLNKLAAICRNMHQYEKADGYLKRALNIQEEAYGKEHPELAETLNNLGNLYLDMRQYEKAEEQLKRALNIQEEVYEKEHSPDLAETLNNLGNLYLYMHQYDKAEGPFKRALNIQEELYGKEHPELAETLNNLGTLYLDMRQYDKAEEQMKRALNIQEEAYGKEHPELAETLNNLGNLYRDMRQYDKAEEQLKRALNIQGEAYEKEHPKLAETLNNLGILYRDMRQYDKAEKILKRALNIQEEAYEKEHPKLAETLNNLGILYRDMRQYDKAEEQLKRALNIQEGAYRKEHPELTETLNNLGNLYLDMRQYDKAEVQLKRALNIQEEAYGKEHPELTETLKNLGNLYLDMRQYDKAEEQLKRALNTQGEAYEKVHNPYFVETLNNLGILYRDMRQYDKAEEQMKRALNIQEEAYGKEHLELAETLNNLGNLYRDMNQYEKADGYLKKALNILEKAYGKEHPELAETLNNLGNLYLDMRQYDKAEEQLKRALNIQEEAYEKEHPELAVTVNNLGNLYRDMHQYEKAEGPFKKALNILEKAYGKEHPELAETLNNLGNLYLDMRQYDKAGEQLKRALNIQEGAYEKEHPELAVTLNNLGNLYRDMHQYEKAEGPFKRALNILEEAYGKEHPKLAETRDNLDNLNMDLKRTSNEHNSHSETRAKLPGKS